MPGLCRAAGLAVLLCQPRLDAQMVEARTSHFRVVTSLPAESATHAAARLERMRSLFARWGLAVASGYTEVVVFADGAAMQPYAPPDAGTLGRAVGFFRPGPDRPFIAIAWRDAGDPLRVLAHELAHQATQPLVAQRPMWFREGLADLLSNLEPDAGGWRAGRPVGAHLEALKRGPWLDWQDVLSARRDTAFLSDPHLSQMFYAQSWLLAHRMLAGRLAAVLPAGLAILPEPQEFPAGLPAELPAELLPEPPTPDEPVTARTLASWEYDHRLAELLRALGRNEEAREALLALRAAYADRPEPAESLGALEMDALHPERAEEWFAQALRLGSANPATHYRYSLLLMRPGRSAESAARHARRAVELDPAAPLHWLAQAQAEMQLGRWEAGRASLAELRARTRDPQLLERAQVEAEEIERRQEQQLRPPPRPPPATATITVMPEPAPPPPPEPPPLAAAAPPAPEPASPYEIPGTLTFLGYIRSVECRSAEKILTVSNRRLAIRVREPRRRPARLYYAPKGALGIPCTLKNVEANVVYRPAGTFGLVNGDVVAVVF